VKSTSAGAEYVVHAEYRLLNALVHDEDSRQDSRVHEDLFIHEIAKSIYTAIEQLDAANIEITNASLFQAANELDYNVNRAVVDAVFSVDDQGASSLNDVLLTLEKARKKKEAADIIIAMQSVSAKNGSLDEEAISQHMMELDRVLKSGYRMSSLKDFQAWSEDYIVELKERAAGRRYPYGDPFLDEHIYKGAYPGAITTIAAGTGQGKSTYILNMINTLLDSFVPCMYISLEMSGVDTYDRLIALRKGIPIQALHANDETLFSIINIVEEEKNSLRENTRFYFVEDPNISLVRLRALIKEFKQRSNSDYAVVAVDLVTQVRDFMQTKGTGTVASAMELAMNELNALAKEQRVHILAVVQFNREAENYKVSSIDDLDMLRPTLSNIKNSAAIAERSRIVLGLFRKKFYADRYLVDDPNAAELPDILEVSVLKNSSGAVGKRFKYLFQGEQFKVTPLLDDEAESLEKQASQADEIGDY